MIRLSLGRDASVETIEPPCSADYFCNFASRHEPHCRAFDSLAPTRSPFGLPVDVAQLRWLHSVKRQRHLAQMPYRRYMPLWIAVVS